MNDRTVSLSLLTLVTSIVFCLAGYVLLHPQKAKVQGQRIQTANTVRAVTFAQSDSSPR